MKNSPMIERIAIFITLLVVIFISSYTTKQKINKINKFLDSRDIYKGITQGDINFINNIKAMTPGDTLNVYDGTAEHIFVLNDSNVIELKIRKGNLR